MKPVTPLAHEDGATLVVFAKDQPQYIPLPAFVKDGRVMTEWEPTAIELDALLQGGRIRMWCHTFGNPLQPVSIEVIEPECGMRGSK